MCRRIVALALALASFTLLAISGSALAVDETSGRAIVPPRSTPTSAPTLTPVQDDELVVDEVRTDQFPKVTARFSINPINGRAPSYLELFDISVVNDGVLE